MDMIFCVMRAPLSIMTNIANFTNSYGYSKYSYWVSATIYGSIYVRYSTKYYKTLISSTKIINKILTHTR